MDREEQEKEEGDSATLKQTLREGDWAQLELKKSKDEVGGD